jgi:hypothetical protein
VRKNPYLDFDEIALIREALEHLSLDLRSKAMHSPITDDFLLIRDQTTVLLLVISNRLFGQEIGSWDLAVASSHPSATEAYRIRDLQGAKKCDRPLVA